MKRGPTVWDILFSRQVTHAVLVLNPQNATIIYNVRLLFKNQLLPKYLANIYTGKESTRQCSMEGLQCWTPGFDDLGQKLVLPEWK